MTPLTDEQIRATLRRAWDLRNWRPRADDVPPPKKERP